jgi:GntR family transcriptional regulator
LNNPERVRVARSGEMTMRALDRDGTAPFWRQSEADLLARLEAGAFAGQFRGRARPVEDYGVGLHTVRQALRQLRADRVIVATRGRRPRVAESAEIHQPMDALYSLFAAVEAAGLADRV